MCSYWGIFTRGCLYPPQPGLDAHDVGYLVVHGPSGALGGLGEIVVAAGGRKIDDGLGDLGEGLDEVVQTLRRCWG